ncbi:MAG TPA: hypothetical protein VHE54_19490 [Puia sp.]|nr:hypothetical protein [Puia sp.]
MPKETPCEAPSAFQCILREAARRSRQAANRQRLKGVLLHKGDALTSVQLYTDLIRALTQAHQEPVEIIDWKELAGEPAPPEPQPAHEYEAMAMARLNSHRPGRLDKIFNTSARRKQRFERSLAAAIEKDLQLFAKARGEWMIQTAEWEKLRRLAQRVLQKDATAYREVMVLFHPEITGADGTVSPVCHFRERCVEIEWHAGTDHVVPHYTITLTPKRKLLQRALTTGEYHRLYQDHVCSWLIHAAREALALLPVEFVVIHLLCDLPDPSTGSPGPQTIVSVIFNREVLAAPHAGASDPRETLKSFRHNMDFDATTGFKPVARLSPSAFTRQQG